MFQSLNKNMNWFIKRIHKRLPNLDVIQLINSPHPPSHHRLIFLIVLYINGYLNFFLVDCLYIFLCCMSFPHCCILQLLCNWVVSLSIILQLFCINIYCRWECRWDNLVFEKPLIIHRLNVDSVTVCLGYTCSHT